MNIKKLLNNKVVRNAQWMVGEQMVQMIISFCIGIITTRYLGPSNYGIINYCAAFVAFFTSIASLGLEGVLVKELVNHPDREGEFVGTALVLRLIAGMFSVISIVLILFVMEEGQALILIVGVLQSLVLVFKAFEVLDFWFQSKLRSKHVAIVKMISYFVVAGYKIFILMSQKPVEWFAFCTSLDFLIIAVLLIWIYRKNDGPQFSFSKSTAVYLLKNSYHFILSGLFVTIYSQMDKIMIENFLGDAAVGYYSIGTVIFGYWVLLTNAIINAVRPSIMRSKLDSEDEYIRRLKQLYAFLAWLCIALALFFTLFGRWLIPFVYGNEYIPAISSVIITMWYSAFAVIGTARGIWIVCENKNKYVKYYIVIGAIANFFLNLIGIQLLGIEGAAWATLFTQVIVCLIAPLFFKETRIHSKYVIEAFLLKGIRGSEKHV